MDWGLPWPGAALAAQAEAAGAQAFCAGEFADLNSYMTATEMALGTSQAKIGPGIAYAFARSPFVHAAAVRHLSALAPGRVYALATLVRCAWKIPSASPRRRVVSGGACSKIRCALVPLIPNEDTPARRG